MNREEFTPLGVAPGRPGELPEVVPLPFTPLEVRPGLAEQLLAEGWKAGAAPQVTARSQDVDREACRQMRCPYCRRRGLAYHPFHKGSRYRVVGLCHDCGTETEL